MGTATGSERFVLLYNVPYIKAIGKIVGIFPQTYYLTTENTPYLQFLKRLFLPLQGVLYLQALLNLINLT